MTESAGWMHLYQNDEQSKQIACKQRIKDGILRELFPHDSFFIALSNRCCYDSIDLFLHFIFKGAFFI